MGRWWWGALIASIVACICAREASACSSDSAPQSVRPLDDEFFLHGAPANRLFYRDNGEPTEVFENWSGPQPMFEVDQAWTVRANRGTDGHHDFVPDLTAFRLVDPGAYVDEHVQWECGTFEPQTCLLEFGPIDLDPPSRPVISDVHVTIYRTQGETAFGCGNTDTMEFAADVEDAQTDPQHLYMLGYMGDDEEDLAEEDQPEIMFWPWPSGFDVGNISISLGSGGTHDRDGLHFRKGRYCFAISAVDLAGNESERSDSVCLDSTDTDDPLVEYGCGCSHRGDSARWLPALVLLGLWRRRRADRRVQSRLRLGGARTQSVAPSG